MASTSTRTLRLLSLLQTHRFWPGAELADRLEVSPRTLRRDVLRLRDLGYPVASSRGMEGGYQLAPGAALPPLLVDEEEAIALVVALSASANTDGGPIAQASLSALAKLIQVLPARLRRRAEALREVTVASPYGRAPDVEATVLARLAQAIRDAERVRFDYAAKGGQAAGQTLRRHVEPHHLVVVGRRWYLVAYDLDRLDWRSFRLDRLADPVATKARFRPRDVPAGGDPARFVRDGLSRRDQTSSITLVADAPAAAVERLVGRWATVTAAGEDRCRVVLETVDPGWAVWLVGGLDMPVTIETASPEIDHTLRGWSERVHAALDTYPPTQASRS